MTVQDHIHLSETIGDAPENAPDTLWYTTSEIPIPRIIGSADYTLNGNLRIHRIRRSGNVVSYRDYTYTLRLDEYGGKTFKQRFEQLEAMLGKIVYLVPHDHASNNSDHDDDIRTMYVSELTPPRYVTQDLSFAEIEITLIDARYT